MKLYKKICLFCVFTLIFTCFGISKVNAQTLGDLQNELNDKKKELEDNKNKKSLTQAEMNTINNNIKSIQNTIGQIQTDTVRLTDEIAELNDKKLDDVLKTANQKKLKRGGFEKRIFLEKTYKK